MIEQLIAEEAPVCAVAPNGELDAANIWLAICDEAECVTLPGNNGGKRLLLTEEMCERMGAALGV